MYFHLEIRISHLLFVIREHLLKKRMFSFGHCPNYPLPPFRATCTSFFGRQNRRFARMTEKIPIIMVTQQIPHMTKSHHGGNMSLIGEVGFCHRHIPTIDNYDDEVGLGVFVDL